MTKFLGLAGLAATAALGFAASAQADVLTFDGNICNGGGACTNGTILDQSYGDIAGQLDVQWDADIASNVGPQDFRFWADSYSDLTNVGYANNGAAGEIFLMPLAGYQVTLNSFDLGSWPFVNRNSQVTLRGGNGDVLFSSGAITVLGSVRSTFTPNITRNDGIRIQFGPDSFNVGIDNISFDVSSTGAIPEPATWAIMIMGFGAAGSMIRRRRAVSAAA